MKSGKRVLRVIGALWVLALLFVTSVSVLAQDRTVVTVWMHNHEPRVPLDEENIARFEAENPDINVELVIIENAEFDTRLNTGLASGEGPDVFNQWTAFMGEFQSAGLLAPVDPVAFGVESLEDIYALYGDSAAAFLAGATFGEQLFGIPTELSVYACYANNEMFAAAGLDAATDFPATWEEMRDVAEQLTVRDANGVPTQRGFDFQWGASIMMYLQFDPMVRQLGASMIDQETMTATVDTPEVAQVMQYWYDWANTWNLGGPQYTDPRTGFWNKEVAIDCSQGNWGVPLIEEAGIDWSVHPVPRWENAVNDNGFALYAYFLMVNAFSEPEVQAAGWKLISYLTSTPDRALTEAGLFQPRVDFTATDTFLEDPVMPTFLAEMSVSFYTPLIPAWTESADVLQRARDRIISGGEDIATVLAETGTEVNDVISSAME
jgi:ABC-type glycerol-3-phosphate transport system substrate-binding protein